MGMVETTPQTDFLKYSLTVGLTAMQGRGFYYPADTAIGPNGRIYTVSRSLEGDPRGVRVTVFDIDSEFYGTFSAFGEDDGQLIWPTSIALDSLNRVCVSDELTHRITLFDDSGNFVDKWGEPGAGPGELDGPSGIAFTGDDNVYVVDNQNSRVQRFTADGRYVSGFGSRGTGAGQFNLPWSLTIHASGDVYVADWGNSRIQRFTSDGEFVAQYGSPGRGDGEFHRPASVAVDGEGYIYVADWGNERVQVLDPEGGFVLKLRGEATDSKWAQEFLSTNLEEAEARAQSDLAPDIDFFVDDPHEESSHIEKYFWAPVSVKLDGDGRLYVTESNRHRIQVYERS